MLGWGETDNDGNSPDLLQMADVPIVTNAQADAHYGTITERMLFAGVATGGPNTCSGDSGGPLIVPHGSGWLLAGVTSFGRTDVDCDAPNNYGGYTRLSRFTAWLGAMLRPHQTAWEARYSVLADEIDIDGDGLTGFGEFAFGLDPTSPDAPETGISSPVHVDDPYLNAVVLDSREVAFSLERSVDMTSWAAPPGGTHASLLPVPTRTPLKATTQWGFWSLETPVEAGFYYRLEATPSRRYSPPPYQLALSGYALKGRTALDHSSRSIDSTTPPPLLDHFDDYFLVDISDFTAAEGIWHLSVRSDAFEPEVGFPSWFQMAVPGTGVTMLEPEASTVLSSGADHRLLAIEFDHRASRFPFFVRAVDSTATGDYRVALFRPYTISAPLWASGTHTAHLTADDSTHRFGEATYSYHDNYSLLGFSAGEFVAVRMDSGLLDPALALVDLETGLALFSNDDGYATGLESFLDFVVPEGGFPSHLALRAGTVEDLSRGPYSLEISRGASLLVGAPATSGSLNSTDPLDPYFSSADYYRDDYLLSGGTSGSPVTVTMQGPSFDAYLYVFEASSGTILETADDFGAGKTETLRFTPEAGHHYIVRATTYDESETGAYTLRAF